MNLITHLKIDSFSLTSLLLLIIVGYYQTASVIMRSDLNMVNDEFLDFLPNSSVSLITLFCHNYVALTVYQNSGGLNFQTQSNIFGLNLTMQRNQD